MKLLIFSSLYDFCHQIFQRCHASQGFIFNTCLSCLLFPIPFLLFSLRQVTGKRRDLGFLTITDLVFVGVVIKCVLVAMSQAHP